VEGNIPVLDFLRFLGDQNGLPVLVDGAARRELDESIFIAATVENANEEMVRAILEVNRWLVSEEKLSSGRGFLRVQRLGPSITTPADISDDPETTRADPDPEHSVFRLGKDGLRRIEAPDSPLAKQGMAPDDLVTVVVTLSYLAPQHAIATLQGALPQTGKPRGEGLRMVEVQGMMELILTGKAGDIDKALRITRAIDVERRVLSPERLVEIIALQKADAEPVAEVIQNVLSPKRFSATRSTRSARSTTSRPIVRSEPYGTRIIPDSRTQKLIVETYVPEDLELIKDLVRVLDVQPKSTRECTHVVELKHARASEFAIILQQLLPGIPVKTSTAARGPGQTRTVIVPHDDTNSLLLQTDPDVYEEILRLVEKLDRSSPPGAGEGEPSAETE
jgi:type II secretory pathway component GspD/PulD (secretin)